jgi:hypothetical protein
METTIYRDCLRVMCDGPFVEDWEFQTLMGVSRDEMRCVHDNWKEPPTDTDLSIVRDALNTLIGYPHGRMQKVEAMMGVTIGELRTALKNIPGIDLR